MFWFKKQKYLPEYSQNFKCVKSSLRFFYTGMQKALEKEFHLYKKQITSQFNFNA